MRDEATHTIFRTSPWVPWHESVPGRRQQSVPVGLVPQLGQQRLDAICSAMPAGSSPWQNSKLERRGEELDDVQNKNSQLSDNASNTPTRLPVIADSILNEVNDILAYIELIRCRKSG